MNFSNQAYDRLKFIIMQYIYINYFWMHITSLSLKYFFMIFFKYILHMHYKLKKLIIQYSVISTFINKSINYIYIRYNFRFSVGQNDYSKIVFKCIIINK